MSLGDVEIRWTNLDIAFDFEVAGQRLQMRHDLAQRVLRCPAHASQPWIFHGAVDHQVGTHDRADRKQRQI